MVYRAIKKLGEGAFGSVWTSTTPEHKSFKTEHPIVAIKKIKSTSNDDPEHEVDILKKLTHT